LCPIKSAPQMTCRACDVARLEGQQASVQGFTYRRNPNTSGTWRKQFENMMVNMNTINSNFGATLIVKPLSWAGVDHANVN
jgi:hypothetical protein